MVDLASGEIEECASDPVMVTGISATSSQNAISNTVPDTVLADNTLIGDQVTVTVSGDVDGDRDVDIFDIVAMASTYGYDEGDPEYIPEHDIDSSGTIDIFDIVIAASNYGETWEP